MVLNVSYVCLHAFSLRWESPDPDPERQTLHFWEGSATPTSLPRSTVHNVSLFWMHSGYGCGLTRDPCVCTWILWCVTLDHWQVDWPVSIPQLCQGILGWQMGLVLSVSAPHLCQGILDMGVASKGSESKIDSTELVWFYLSGNLYSDETKSEQVTTVIIQSVVISYRQFTETENPLLRNSAESLATFCDLSVILHSFVEGKGIARFSNQEP
jgi:hypothetical protein